MKKQYDVGVVGCWYWGNYGSLLNGYATYSILKSLGLSPLNIISPYNKFESHAEKFFKVAYQPEDISELLPFRRLHELNSICDSFLTGSDQIWGYKKKKDGDTKYNEYFRLNFAEDTKRKVSFATSFGNYQREPDDVHQIFQRLFQRYQAISVRELEGVDILREQYHLRATQVMEPVLDVPVEKWYELAEHSAYREREPYIITYILDPTEEKRRAIQYYSQKAGMKAINILDGFSKAYKRNYDNLNLPNTLPNIWCADLLRHYADASYVITDSFHGACFAIVFNKPFIAIGNYKRGIKRFETLLTNLGLQDRLIYDATHIPHEDRYLNRIDYTDVNTILQTERERSVNWLKQAMMTPVEKLPSIYLPIKEQTATSGEEKKDDIDYNNFSALKQELPLTKKTHYDIGVVGCWWGSNYGSILNGYAVYNTLKSLGLSVLMIHKHNAKKNDWEIYNTHNEKFIQNFYPAEDVSPIIPFSRLHELNDVCDMFLTGSDQIWNYGINRIFDFAFMLNFVDDDKKKLSFGTSFGHAKDATPQEKRPMVKALMQRYTAVSVREQSGADICRDVYDVKAQVVVEPVFCMTKEQYLEIAAKSKLEVEEPYILTYILDPTPEKRKAIQYYSEISGMKALNVLDGDPRVYERNKAALNLPNTMGKIGTEDFMKLYANASLVMTDSFHGTAFSIIFNKPFLSITNFKRGSVRFGELLGKFDLQDRLVPNPEKIPLDKRYFEQIDFTHANAIMQRERESSIAWLRNVIETPKEKLPSIVIQKAYGKAITENLPKQDCMGCGACVSTCPKQALQLRPDNLGYYRAVLNTDTCINCGKCLKVCPSYHIPSNAHTATPKLYAFIAADKEILERSSSGGIFSLLAKKALEKNGVVGGAAWKDDFTVEHIFIDKESQLPKLQKSKYLQSYLGDMDAQVKARLEQGQFVLFSGCPCQIAGLHAYLGKEYDNLITVDLLCANTPSSKFFQKYAQETFGEQLQAYEFREKSRGWNCISIKADLKDGTSVLHYGGKEDDYQKAFHRHIMCAPHCENCKYQRLPRFGDLTIGDFWGINKKMPELDYKNGVSLVLCNSAKGQAFFDSIREQDISFKKEVPLAWMGGNGYALEGKRNYAPIYRDAFFQYIQTQPFSKALKLAFDSIHDNDDMVRASLPKKINPLQFDSRQFAFHFNSDIWEQHVIHGKLVLIPIPSKPGLGNYASISLCNSLQKGEKYQLQIRFKLKTDANFLNLHLKEANSKKIQIIYRHKVQPQNAKEWVTLSIPFVSNSNIYSEFMVGAAQITGENRFFAIDYIYIEKQ